MFLKEIGLLFSKTVFYLTENPYNQRTLLCLYRMQLTIG
ncbi:hypothetical protein M595_4060 [Lyngbya aestuarii BL J]|uniref:Uncharacterized protein n=1 Tax=Lyngbya aestuarii BL J TaxID=1348334 RepID=U7QDS7_9CYAN|nr:hypothetical protein M595_4060 [Lyngbya aestuarii BL J]